MLWQQKARLRLEQLSIRLTGLLIILCVLVVFPPIQAQTAQFQYSIEKKLLDEAIVKKSVDALNQFMLTHPKTVWIERAIYYRDQTALNDAKANETLESIEQFIQQYPDSVWLDSAIYARDKVAYGVARKINTKATYEAFIKKYPSSPWIDKVEHRLNTIKKPKVASQRSTKTDVKPLVSNPVKSPTLTQKRMSRALQIYSEIDKNRQLKKKEKLRKEKIAREIKSNCNYLKDRLKRHEESVRFYRLDENGDRVFLTDEEIAKNLELLDMAHSKNCSE